MIYPEGSCHMNLLSSSSRVNHQKLGIDKICDTSLRLRDSGSSCVPAQSSFPRTRCKHPQSVQCRKAGPGGLSVLTKEAPTAKLPIRKTQAGRIQAGGPGQSLINVLWSLASALTASRQ